MDREHLTRLVDDPARVQRDDIADLKAMAERYPWFSGAHLLLAVGEHAAGDVLFDEQLRVAAAHLPSRAVLFDRSGRSTAEEPVVVLPIERPAAPAPEPPVMVAQPAVAEEIITPAQVQVEEEEAIQEEVLPEADVDLAPAEEEAPDPLDLVIRESAISAAFALAIEDAIAADTSVRPATPEPIVPPPPTTPLASSGKLKFTQWLSMTDEGSAAAPAVPRSAAVQAELPVGTTASEKRPPSGDLPRAGLIQELIQQQATRQKPKAEFFDPQRAAKRSLEDHADLVTETLARIYEKQGNYAKAIAAYERLAVKHPEKRDYFRGLAKLLQGL